MSLEAVSSVLIETPDDWRSALETLQHLRPQLTESELLAKREDLQSAGYRLFGIPLDSKFVSIAGIVTVPHLKFVREIIILDMATHPDYERRGFARRMLEFIEELAKAEKAGRIFLHSIKSGELYLRCGYTELSKTYVKVL